MAHGWRCIHSIYANFLLIPLKCLIFRKLSCNRYVTFKITTIKCKINRWKENVIRSFEHRLGNFFRIFLKWYRPVPTYVCSTSQFIAINASMKERTLNIPTENRFIFLCVNFVYSRFLFHLKILTENETESTNAGREREKERRKKGYLPVRVEAHCLEIC